jgi:hypothetical protein
MLKLETIQKDIASLPPSAQQIIFDLVEVLKKRYLLEEKESTETTEDWSDFIGCISAESDLSRNYKSYLKQKFEDKYDNY